MPENNWRDEANCATTDPDLMFPSLGESTLPAKRICAECPVVNACLLDALTINEFDDRGVRGGLSRRERIELRRAAA